MVGRVGVYRLMCVHGLGIVLLSFKCVANVYGSPYKVMVYPLSVIVARFPKIILPVGVILA